MYNAAGASKHHDDRRGALRAEFINPFLIAATDVLKSEINSEPTKGPLSLEHKPFTTQEVTALIAVTGNVQGSVFYCLSERTALNLVGIMMGKRYPFFDEMAKSGIAELGNVITGRASMLLAEAGYPSKIAPPVMLEGRGTMISTLKIPRLVVPLETKHGVLEVHVALQETIQV
jgi:chemotaxis protein CheX